MRVQTEEWQRFIPGVRMYKGKMTLFYNGEILWDDENEEYLIYNEDERMKWEVIIVLPGVEIIPELTFQQCMNLKVVIMSDTVQRIEDHAFWSCSSLDFVKLSRHLEYIGGAVFAYCVSLTSIFIPESCREIRREAFLGCTKLIILSVSRNTTLGEYVIDGTAMNEMPDQDVVNNNGVNEWIRNLNQAEEFALHRECISIEPTENNIYEIIKQQGLLSLHVKNEIGLTALEYLKKNPYIENQIDQHKLIKRLVLDLMGEMID